MKVGEAQVGQILYAKGRIPKSFTRNLGEDELSVCKKAGFLPGFLMPAWVDGEDCLNAWPGSKHDSERITPLFYLGPVWLSEAVGGLKKHHLFLYEGEKIALEGYDFRHLQAAESM